MKIAVVLPRGMNFASEGATSIDLVTKDLIANSEHKRETIVIGEEVPVPFKGFNFTPIKRRTQREFNLRCLQILSEDTPDIIVVHQYAATAAFLAKSLKRSRIILYRHGLLKKPRNVFSRFMKVLSFKRIEKIIFVSEFIKQEFLKDYPSLNNRSYVINNAIDTDYWAPAEKKRVVTYVGRCRRDKGILELIMGFNQVKDHDWTLHLIVAVQTDAEDAFFRELASIISQHSNIKLSRNLQSEGVRNELAMSSIAALPSIVKEGFPRAVVEAMSCGCAVVATNSGGTPEAAGDAAVLLNNAEPTGIGEALELLIGNPETLSHYAEKARVRIVELLSIKTITKRYDQLISDKKHD